MASVIYNEFKRASAAGEIDLNADDIRVALVMSNTTCDTENAGITVLSDFTTLDECDGANYVRKALDSEAVNKDDANNRAEFDATDVTWTALGASTRTVPGALVFKFVSDDDDSIPIAYVELPTALTPDGSNFLLQWNAEGILNLT